MTVEIAPLFVPTPGGPELLIILFIAILLFGANKIPKLARSTGEAMGEFQKGREKVETELEEMRQAGSLDDLEDGPSTTTTSSSSSASSTQNAQTTETETAEAEPETETESN